MGNSDHLQDFDAIKARLEEIVDAVSDDSIPLDDALDLYEEAVALGMRVGEVLEDNIAIDESALDDQASADAPESAGAAAPAADAASVAPAATAAEGAAI